MKNIIWQHTENNSLKVTHIADSRVDSFEYAEFLKSTDSNFENYNPVLLDAPLPESRFWREAWVVNNNGIYIDIAKARDVFKAMLRQARQPKLDTLDIAFMRALEQGDTTQIDIISEQKQILRDLTKNPQITSAQTVADLIALWPSDFTPLDVFV